MNLLSTPKMWSFLLPRYHFHIIAEITFLDDKGTHFEDDTEALGHARQLAAEIVKTSDHQRGAVVVENEDNGGMFELAFPSWNN